MVWTPDITPVELARQEGVSAKKVRGILRRLYPHPKYQRWQLTEAMVEAVRRELHT